MGTDDVFLVTALVGCHVFTAQGENLGELRDVIHTGANDVFVVGEGPAEILIPALKTVVTKIDLVGKRIEVDLPAGLREL